MPSRPAEPPRNLCRTKGKLGLAVLLGLVAWLTCPAAIAQQPAQQQDTTNSSLEADLDRMIRRLYLASGEDQRASTLVSLLTDPSPIVVRSALDLALREQASSSRLSEPVVEAVLGLLAHAEPGIRTKAASLADLIATPRAGNAILAQLRAESQPEVAEVLLSAGARWPDQLDPQAVLRWVRADFAMTAGQARALAELNRSGRLSSASDSAVVLQSISLVADASLTPPMCRLLANLGGPAEHARLSALLGSSDASVRRKSAAALADVPELSGIVIHAAKGDPALVESAALATRHLPPSDALATLLMLPEASPDAARERIRAVSAKLPIRTLISLADGPWSASRRVDLLSTARDRRVESPARGRALVMLAEALYERGDTELAANVASLAEPMLDGSEPWLERATRLASAAVEDETPPGNP